MGFRFRRRVSILPGVRLNFSRSGISTSIGTRGLWATYGKRGRRLTASIPGSGISYTTTSNAPSGAPARRGASWLLWLLLALAIGAWLAQR
jgi:hypothetical protein